jgi:hypothetical protein
MMALSMIPYNYIFELPFNLKRIPFHNVLVCTRYLIHTIVALQFLEYQFYFPSRAVQECDLLGGYDVNANVGTYIAGKNVNLYKKPWKNILLLLGILSLCAGLGLIVL